jgi:hypothetical protein
VDAVTTLYVYGIIEGIGNDLDADGVGEVVIMSRAQGLCDLHGLAIGPIAGNYLSRLCPALARTDCVYALGLYRNLQLEDVSASDFLPAGDCAFWAEPLLGEKEWAQARGPVKIGPLETGPIEIGPVEIGPVETGPLEIGPVETGPLEIGPVKTGPFKIGPDKIGPLEIGPDKIGPLEIGPLEIGPFKIGPIEIGPVKTGPVKTGPVKTGPLEIGPTEIGPIEIGPDKIGPVKTGPFKIGPVKTGPLEIGPTEIGPIEIGPVKTGPHPYRCLHDFTKAFAFALEEDCVSELGLDCVLCHVSHLSPKGQLLSRTK